MLALMISLSVSDAFASCTTDIECKGDRICTQGTCSDPASSHAGGCSVDVDCPGSMVCQQSSCVSDGKVSASAPKRDAESSPDLTVQGLEFVRGERVVVLPFRDHRSDDDRDRVDTGIRAQERLVAALQEIAWLKVLPDSPKTYDPAVGFSTKQAGAFARSIGADYAVFGEVLDYYEVAPMTFRVDRAALAIKVAAADGTLAYARTWRKQSGTNIAGASAVLGTIGAAFCREVAPDQ